MHATDFRRFAGPLLIVLAMPAIAADNPLALDDPEIYKRSLAALTQLFVIAVLLESAFATIFNWRVFLAYFSRTGVKTLVMIVGSLLVVNIFDVDVLASLLSAYKPEAVPSGPVSKLITALILAGGSAGVYNVMKALGYRNDNRDEEARQRPAPDKAWLAVRVKRGAGVGPAIVRLQKHGPIAAFAGPNPPVPIVGTVSFSRRSLADLMLRRSDRFPESGGYVLLPDVVYELSVESESPNGKVTWPANGAFAFALAPGAIVDITANLQ